MCKNFLYLCLLLLLCSISLADSHYWDAGGSSNIWDDASNWVGDTAPISTDNAYLRSGHIAYVDSRTGNEQIYNLYPIYSTYSGGTININNYKLTVDGRLFFGNNTNSYDGIINVYNDGTLTCNYYGLAMQFKGSGHELNISDGGTVELTDGSIDMGSYTPNNQNISTINIDDGTLDVYNGIYLGYQEQSGKHYINMSSGTINADEIYIAKADSTTGHFQFDGGTVNLLDKLVIEYSGTRNGSMDMQNDATLIIDGDCESTINGYITAGCLTSHGGSGSFDVDYDVTNSGKTTVTVNPPSNVIAYLERAGVPLNPANNGVTLTYSGRKIIVNYTAGATNNYRFGIVIDDTTLETLEKGTPEYDTGDVSSTPIYVRYPYDWDECLDDVNDSDDFLTTDRLLMPGVIVDDHVYIIDTHELSAVELDEKNSKVRALLLLHEYSNIGYDTSDCDIALTNGQEIELSVWNFGSIDAANEKIYGTSDSITGTITQMPYKSWDIEAMSNSDYNDCAAKFEGIFDWVIIREANDPTSDLADIFYDYDINVIPYHYTGALRNNTNQVTQDIIDDYGMLDSNDLQYCATTSPDGAWLLLNIRDANARDLLVQRAVNDVNNGFDGIFLDAPSFWADSLGRCGGNDPNASCSWAYARYLLLQETKQAIQEVNPDAKMFILGNNYWDSLGIADGIIKERMYWAWHVNPTLYYNRQTKIRKDLDNAWETEQLPFAAKNIAYGFKGYNPIAVQSAKNFVVNPTGLNYIGLGDFYIKNVDGWSDGLVEIATGSTYITNISSSSAYIYFKQ
jgi:hypothetical protein